jgi:hypothetical protein
MRSAPAGTASKVMALKTTAAVPMSVIERMFHLLVVTANNKGRSHSVPKTQTRNLFRCAGTCLPLFIAVQHSRLGTVEPLRVFIESAGRQ